ncbi:MAG: bifunctional 4-hydroxy-2-oxoglutarate aldolase/2-dehydro-3-deoxy-phosphogluconate aldolase [Candidatus Ancaeobacter aquaticus]|nr:bifunctional 4-hydroxy-2-oxoglutarate aldolase/2-dehydro-3-deoxy-phosphogluconate aldolase [Candidatus Ancaeobacter aquaticus]
MNIQSFLKKPIMGIVRGVDMRNIAPLVDAVITAGLETIEFTMNTPSAPEIIREAKNCADNAVDIGAGTVLTMEQLHSALEAGATFIVMPVLVDEIVHYCVKHSIPVFPGAFTPQEIYNAWNAGASMVKVFPSKYFGPSYMKEIKGPFNDIQLLACGGVTPDTINDFFSQGASAVAFGGSILRKDWIDQGRFDLIKVEIEKLIRAHGNLNIH